MPFDFTIPETVDFDIAFEDTKVDDWTKQWGTFEKQKEKLDDEENT